MLKRIRTSKVTKVIVCYLSLMIFLQIVQPMSAYALTEGPSQPEFNSFTPIGTSDMVDLSSGDFNYNIPIMDVGGYPINLAYNSGVTMDQESSWVGLGWNLNIGQINRNVRGLPDDFKGDEIITENNLRNNITVGVQGYVNPQIIGAGDVPSRPSPLSAGLNLQYNNYHGMTAIPSFGVSFKLNDNVSVGMQLSSSNQEGASVTPSVTLSQTEAATKKCYDALNASISPSITYNSRQGLSSFNLSSSVGYKVNYGKDKSSNQTTSSGSGSISFLNNTFTPTKRLGLKNSNATLSFSGGPDVWGGHVEASITALASVQKLIEKIKKDKSYGYEFTDNATEFDLLDFNREKEETTVTKNTLVLPVTNYTYDILSIQGQGLSGTIRPYRSQVGYVYEPRVNDISSSAKFGFEMEGGAGFHGGASIRRTKSNSYTGNWNTSVTPLLKEKTTGNNLTYEKVYYKNTGENRIDNEYSSLFKNRLGEYSPITFKLDENKQAINEYHEKILVGSEADLSQVGTTPILSKLKRTNREMRNQVVQKVSNFEVYRYGLNNLIKHKSDAPSHHTAGYIITDENGSRHVYGETAYNNEKQEVTFATSKTGTLSNGLVEYGNGENSINNSSGIDHYYNNVKTPKYAHTYLITSILSPDYEDLTLNGVSDDDLGSYTKFEYTTTFSNYKWRVPFKPKTASYNEGLKTNKTDQKGSYLYGSKELKYVTRIITKTHVAYIELENRNDGCGVEGVDGNFGAGRMKCIKSIKLYSKPEVSNSYGMVASVPSSSVKPIKTAHFEYNYSLCKNIDNNINPGDGKLTLKKVYFTYRDSNMGMYTPYKFNYSETNNYDYNPKNYDIWGNYKENTVTPSNQDTNTTPQEFPYVDQNNKEEQDKNASAWSLSSIELPSGSKIELTYESDDYQYVQNKKAMQMFKVAGVTTGDEITSLGQISTNLYGGLIGEAKYVAVKINEEDENFSDVAIIDKYIGDLKGKAIYFNFFLNMKGDDRDYISGYFEMDKEAVVSHIGNDKYLLVPMKHINREGKFNDNNPSNPISVAGWFFGRENLNHQLYNDSFNPNQTNIVTIARSILSNLEAMTEIFKGPNGRLQEKGCAKSFVPQKSWIRLMEPSGSKLGGGARVKKIVMNDGWIDMIGQAYVLEDENERYEKKYGQEYDYSLNDGSSSGVATYEPNVCKENPLVQPFYHKPEKMAARSYQEKPFGESFFPTPTITYRKVTVKNITAADDDNEAALSKTRSGKVITEFYTSYDFPTKTDFTPLNNPIAKKYYSNENEVIQNMIRGMLGLKIDVKTDLTMSQGFVIETNDMNGKMKKQEVLNNSGDKISSVEYIYNTVDGDPTTLNSELTVINKDGTVTNDHALGMHYDVINDLRESYSETSVAGVAVNVDFIPTAPFPIVLGMGVPERSKHRQILHTSVTTKVINKTGILKEKIAYDLGSRVSTKNLAWDAQTGQVILTQTVNEFDDTYYSLNYPAYWYYDYMGMASENTDFSNLLIPNASSGWKLNGIPTPTNIQKVFKLGDEIVIYKRTRNVFGWSTQNKKLWVSDYYGDTGIKLIDAQGQTYNPSSGSTINNRLYFKVIRSGYRNQQMASMASITLMENPLIIDLVTGEGILNQDLINFNTIPDSNIEDPKIINASAIEYDQDWKSQCENGLPEPNNDSINKYLFNVLGEWRPVKSYAYLTGRNATANSNTRKSGYFKKFNLFYKKNGANWERDFSNWTFASQVTMYNPYGVELENKDALNRYSAAQYGYNYKFPVAVGSNAKYQEIGYDGFEDYFNDITPAIFQPHFGFQDKVNATNYVTNKTSHTGKKSVVVKGKKRLIFERKVDACLSSNNQTSNNN